ncbi:MAG: hypothetical protein ACYTBZ_05830 [Planctomycetota bacterium]
MHQSILIKKGCQSDTSLRSGEDRPPCSCNRLVSISLDQVHLQYSEAIGRDLVQQYAAFSDYAVGEKSGIGITCKAIWMHEAYADT